MTPSFSLIPVLYLLGAAHGLFLAFVLLTRSPGSARANRYLGCYTLVFVAALVDYFIELTGLERSLIGLRTLLWPKEFLYGVLVYFYTREMTTPGRYVLRGRQWWHFALPLLHVAVTWPLLLLPGDTQFAILNDQPGPQFLQRAWALLLGDAELVVTVVQLTVYLGLSLRLIRRHQKRLPQTFSYREKVNLSWLRNLLVGTFAVYFIWLAAEFLNLEESLDAGLDFALGLSMVLLIYSMSILGLRQPRIFAAVPADARPDIGTVESVSRDHEQKYRNSALSAEMSGQLMREVDALMHREKPYLDGSLSLPQLAARMNISSNYLSQAINQHAGQNFFDYINAHRVEEVKALMRKQPDQTVLDLALDAGFNSKSAFYTAFRRHAGKTPGQYRKTL
ncbi:AraC family transcriptional regulator [Elongatibacter sediminis]|uniref:Helix-turn-helix domain-containing protein n=1 Tax=Elongatibacter sediminis TaxID=3119006 RepID=A0AAW9R902_9GAMM